MTEHLLPHLRLWIFGLKSLEGFRLVQLQSTLLIRAPLPAEFLGDVQPFLCPGAPSRIAGRRLAHLAVESLMRLPQIRAGGYEHLPQKHAASGRKPMTDEAVVIVS